MKKHITGSNTTIQRWTITPGTAIKLFLLHISNRSKKRSNKGNRSNGHDGPNRHLKCFTNSHIPQNDSYWKNLIIVMALDSQNVYGKSNLLEKNA